MDNKNDVLKKTTAMNLYLRIFVGGFLVYLAYTLAIDLGNASGNDLVIFKKDYYDPMLDIASEESDNPTDEME